MSERAPVPMSEHARAYAERGWAVLPLWSPRAGGGCGCRQSDCDNVGKHPIPALAPHGLRDASSSPAAVSNWWSVHPRANVGIRTGAASGLVVLDVDGREGVEGLRELVDRHGQFDALWARTGSGGWHAYLAHPGGEVPNSAKRVGPGLDVRGDGGYVVAPPSLHASGNRYRWADASAEVAVLPALEVPPPMPAWLLERARPAARELPAQALHLRSGGASPYVAAAIDGEVHEVASTPSGQRNHRLNLAAYRLGRLVGGGLADEHTVTAALLSAARSAGLGDREARATIRSGISAGAGNPRRVELDSSRRGPLAPERGLEAEAC